MATCHDWRSHPKHYWQTGTKQGTYQQDDNISRSYAIAWEQRWAVLWFVLQSWVFALQWYRRNEYPRRHTLMAWPLLYAEQASGDVLYWRDGKRLCRECRGGWPSAGGCDDKEGLHIKQDGDTASACHPMRHSWRTWRLHQRQGQEKHWVHDANFPNIPAASDSCHATAWCERHHAKGIADTYSSTNIGKTEIKRKGFKWIPINERPAWLQLAGGCGQCVPVTRGIWQIARSCEWIAPVQGTIRLYWWGGNVETAESAECPTKD